MANKMNQSGQLAEGHHTEPSQIRVGELLVEAGIVSSAEMTEAIQVSKRLGVPIGRVLTMSGWVPERVLEAALQVQQLIRHNEVPVIAAVNSLQRVHQIKMSITEALAEEDLRLDLEHDPNKLAELLVDSNIVSALQMERAVQASFDQGVPLGSTLVMQGFMSEAVLPSLERIQRQITEGTLSREDGLKQIQATFVLWVKADESLKKPLEIDVPPLRRQANRMTEDTSVNAKGASEAEDSISSQAYPQSHSQAPSTAPSASASPSAQTVPTSAAARPVAQPPVERPVSLPEPPPGPEDTSSIRLVDLLKHAGLFSQADVQRRYDSMLKDPVRSARFFLELGLVDEDDLKSALRTHSLMQRGQLTRDEAALALREARTNNLQKELSGENPERVKRYMDKRWRGHMGKVVGGALFGAFVAGMTMGKRNGK